jgi:hypothetical protein
MDSVNRRQFLAAFVVTASIAVAALFGVGAQSQGRPDTLPGELSDKEFWSLVSEYSEPDGFFRSDNLVSNERTFQEVIPELKKRALPNGVYLGVGPDQNFTYIAALKPRLAFIVDIRRGNLDQQLFYKALIEMSSNRVDFVSRLFGRAKPEALVENAAGLSAAALFDAFADVDPDPGVFQKNLAEIETWLTEKHGFALTPDDLKGIEYVARAFFAEGPDLRYSFPSPRLARVFPTYSELQRTDDGHGTSYAYLASEDSFRIIREFERKNLLVPVIGDFAGPKALRAVGNWIASHGGVANYIYTSNVEQYLFQGDAFRRYYASVGTLPLAEQSTFIRSYFDRGFYYPPGVIMPDLHSVQLLDPVHGLLKAFSDDQIHAYDDVVARSHP